MSSTSFLGVKTALWSSTTEEQGKPYRNYRYKHAYTQYKSSIIFRVANGGYITGDFQIIFGYFKSSQVCVDMDIKMNTVIYLYIIIYIQYQSKV
jgi:hypothetical protein